MSSRLRSIALLVLCGALLTGLRARHLSRLCAAQTEEIRALQLALVESPEQASSGVAEEEARPSPAPALQATSATRAAPSAPRRTHTIAALPKSAAADDAAAAIARPASLPLTEIATISIAEAETPRIFGVLLVDGAGRVLIESAAGIRDWLREGDEFSGWEILHVGSRDVILGAREPPARAARWCGLERTAWER